MAAKKKPLESKPAQLGTVRVTVAKMELPPERPAGRIIGEGIGRGAGARAAPPDRSEGDLMANVLVFAETRDGELRKVALEAVTAARKLADASGGGEVHALLAGPPGVGAQGGDSWPSTAPTSVIVVESADFAQFARESLAATHRRPREGGRLSRRGAGLLGAGARPRPARGGAARRADRERRDRRLP